MKVYTQTTTSPFKAKISFTEDKRVTVHIYGYKDGTTEYKELGKHGQPLLDHSSYSILYKESGFLIRNKENIQYKSLIKIVPTNQITMGSRMKYEEVENRYGGRVLAQIDTNSIRADYNDLNLMLFRISKDNAEISVQQGMNIEYLPFNSSEVFSKGSPRHSLWDTYSVSIDGKEYKFAENGKPLGSTDSVVIGNREYVDVTVIKYSNKYGRQLKRDEDDEDVFLEWSAGLCNTSRVKLTKGAGAFRWYNFGYKGTLKLKLGWRWYVGIADMELNIQ